jgi:uncharacterized protein YdaU (DUF1376 family)
LNFYKRHLGDYAKDAGHLSMLETGAYTLLLDRYYTTERPIANRAEAHRVCRARSSAERAAVDAVLAEFFITDGEAFMSKRAEQEIAKAAHQRTVNQEVGKLGGRPKGSVSPPKEKPNGNRIGLRSEPNRNPSQTPDSTIHSVPTGTGASAPPTDRDLVFANGVALLTAAGVKESNARSFLAAQCKAHGEPAVKAALDRCATERPIEPVGWLQAALGPASGNKPRKVDALMAGNIAAARRYQEAHGE